MRPGPKQLDVRAGGQGQLVTDPEGLRQPTGLQLQDSTVRSRGLLKLGWGC